MSHDHLHTVHITITDTTPGHARVLVSGSAAPRVGAPASPAESLALDLANTARRHGHTVTHTQQDNPLAAFAERLLSPDDLGWAVSSEVRCEAARALGRKPAAQDEAHRSHA